MYSKIFNKLFDYYITKNKQTCLRRPDVKQSVKIEDATSNVVENTPTTDIATTETTEEYVVKKNIFGDLVARSKK